MEIQVKTALAPFRRFLSRYHYLLFFIFVFGCLSVVMLLLNQTITSTDSANGYTSEVNNTSLDQGTINHLRALKSPGQSTQNLTFGGRVNPF